MNSRAEYAADALAWGMATAPLAFAALLAVAVGLEGLVELAMVRGAVLLAATTGAISWSLNPP